MRDRVGGQNDVLYVPPSVAAIGALGNLKGYPNYGLLLLDLTEVELMNLVVQKVQSLQELGNT